ncbi:hypothetical protein M422DRAFT_212723 [Sphaerobolus stellatus SS14]|uniref:tRNA (uracil-O(2)-)-methyltransferase n=1 Tax=Sphaerobolus stellatus (strain SS14) TaxID=990650 RepID=A0A0C9VCN8_SPHS4|nr:hypothetical protein M422DRAFT_212723 [Sphaerobolus stellatus SS14]
MDATSSSIVTRTRFQEEPCLDGRHIVEPLSFREGTEAGKFVPIITCAAQFPVELLQTALMTLIDHPEYNSSLILRSETIAEADFMHDPFTQNSSIPEITEYIPTSNIRRKLLPRRPGRDAPLEQDCTFYTSEDSDSDEKHPSLLILTPRVPPEGSLPYYHPAVSHLAFRYITQNDGAEDTKTDHLVIEAIPLDNSPLDLSSRLYRTCIALLETVDRYGWGALTNYRKRVVHDVIISRNEYQDLYLIMRERHKSLVGTWKEVTDPLKHVYEDVGIATFLMLLWKNTYHHNSSSKERSSNSEDRPWDNWAHPPGGFVDVGCGNGLLTHILISEGYDGEGFDIRQRSSWSQYPESTRKHLHVEPFNPFEPHPHLKPNVFLIGNHADELTPWIPVLAITLPACGYLSIPCCPWDFDARFERGRVGVLQVPQDDPKSAERQKLIDSIGLGVEGQSTSYAMYRIWLAYLSKACGWKVESEVLRIPSTRNWAVVGREVVDQVGGRAFAEEILEAVKERGVFKARPPEGKSH